MSNELELSAKTYGLDLKQAEQITKGLDTILAERVALQDTYEDVISLELTKDNQKTFKELRLMIRNNRTKGLKIWHKTNKAFYLAGGNFVQALYNKEVAENERMEENLLKAENHFENLEKERLAELQTKRLELVTPYVEDAELIDYSIMGEDFFNDYLELKKAKFEKAEVEAKAEAERMEKERLAEIERQKAIELENAKLKAEAEAKQKQLDLEAKQRANKEKLRLGVEKKAQERREELAREERAKQDAILLKAKQESKKLAEQLQAKKDAELKQKKQADELAEKNRLAEIELAKAPLKDKFNIWIDSLSLTDAPKDNEISKEIISKFNGFKAWAKKEVNKI